DNLWVVTLNLERLRKLAMEKIAKRYQTFKLMSQFELPALLRCTNRSIAACCAARLSQRLYALLRCWSVIFGLIARWRSLSIATTSTRSRFFDGSLIRRQKSRIGRLWS